MLKKAFLWAADNPKKAIGLASVVGIVATGLGYSLPAWVPDAVTALVKVLAGS